MRNHFSQLKRVTKSWLQTFADKMYSGRLINEDVRDSATFEKIEGEFSAILSLCQQENEKLKDACQTFLFCLGSEGGPAKVEALELAKELEREVSKHDLKWSFTDKGQDMELNPKLEISSEGIIAIKLKELLKKFTELSREIKRYYNDCGQYKVIDFANWMVDNEYTDDKNEIKFTRSATIHEIFEGAHLHYNFLNCVLFIELAEEFPLNEDLKSKLEQYLQEVHSFEQSTELQHMKTAIDRATEPKVELTSKIVITVTGALKDRTKTHLNRLLEYLFGKNSKKLNLISIEQGSLFLLFLVPASLSQCLISKAESKLPYMQYLGIFKLIINSQIILDEDENVEFTFEDSLLHVIKHIDSNAEYERIALLLIEFKIQLNYQNTEGCTTLMLASEGGHIEVFKSLLLNGAHQFELNSLACTVLSRHIQKSIGGEKIVPQPGTCVGDMLERAVRERGVSGSLYKPFVSIIENTLRERFRWLHSCFQVLDNKFVDTSSEILTNTALVTEARRNFCSYIEEEAKCDNAHQLQQLLQPHYSCLNINLLNIACMILEPIKEMVDSYNTKLKTFKDTTTLSELVMMTTEKEHYAGGNCSKLILKLNKSWGSKTITELNKMESFLLLPSSPRNLVEICQDRPSFTCTYFIPTSQFQPVLETFIEKRNFLLKIGVHEVFVADIPVLMEDADESFKFEDALQKAYQDNDEDVLFFLIELNISLPSASAITSSVNIGRTKNNISINDFSVESIKPGKEAAIKMYLSEDLDINLKNDQGMTSLMTAVLVENYEIVQKLLDEHVNVDFQNNIGNTALMIACKNKNVQIIDLLLSKDPDINIQNNDGWTALIIACCNGHRQVVKLLLSKDPDINIQNNDGVNALMTACRSGYHQVVKLLLSKDPDINIQDNNGMTALIAACHKGHQQVVKLLLSKDPDINIQDRNGWTALIVACRYGHHQVVALLLSKDPDINIQNNDGVNSLMTACREGYHQVVKLLLSKDPDINILHKDGWTALIAACHYGHYQVVQLLLSKDLNINIQDNDIGNALMAACHKGHHQIVELLLNKDPDINIQDNDGMTALMTACRYGYHQVAALLLSKNPDINIQELDGWTALMIACYNAYHRVIELLLSKDPDVNIQSNDGSTALLIACHNGHHQVVKLLLSKDPNINIQNNNGWTALMIATQNGHHQVVKLLLSKDPNINIQNNDGLTALMIASGDRQHQVVELLLSKDPDINIQDTNGWTALFAACRYGHHLVVELLLSKDPDINIQDTNGWTALMIACNNGHQQVVELLLNKDPDINIQNNGGANAFMVASGNGHLQVTALLLIKYDIDIQNSDGWTALMAACRYGQHDVVELLLSANTDINIQDNEGLTALMLACSNGHHQVVELLLNKDPDINIQNNDEVTALMTACYNGHHQAVELLLNKDPDINIQDESGMTALMFACAKGHHQVVELLLSKNPDINIQNNSHGGTALMSACRHGHHQVVEQLLRKNPDVNIQSIDGATALMIATKYGYYQIVKLLLKSEHLDVSLQDNDGYTTLAYATANGYHEVVKILLIKCSNLQHIDELKALTCVLFCSDFGIKEFTDGDEMLHNIFNQPSSNHLKTLEVLLSFHPNHIHSIGDMKLHSLAVAAMANNFEAVEILMRKCDISPENIIKAFTIACYGGQHYSPMMILLSKKLTTLSNDERELLVAAAEGDVGTLVRMLFEVGMSPDTPLVGGITPLMIAVSCGHIDIADTLIQAGADVNKTNDEGYSALDMVENIESYNRDNIKELLITHSAADPVPADPVSTDPVPADPVPADPVVKKRQTSFVRVSLQSMLGKIKSFMIKASNPTYMKQKVSTASSRVDYMPPMTASSLPVLVC